MESSREEPPRAIDGGTKSSTGDVELSVILVSFNTRELLRGCVQSLLAQDVPGRLEIVIVDNASRDGSADMVASSFPHLTLIRNQENVGFARAANQGIAAAHGSRLLLLNPDSVVQPGALRVLLDRLDRDTSIGMIGPKLLNADGTLQPAARRRIPTPEVAFVRLSGLGLLFPSLNSYNRTELDFDNVAEVEAISGSCMMIRREVLSLGGLDERFFLYGEDLDWCLRIHAAGWKVVYEPAAVVVHLKGESGRGRERLRACYEFYRAMALFHRKHFARARSPLTNFAVYSGIAAIALPHLFLTLLRGRRV